MFYDFVRHIFYLSLRAASSGKTIKLVLRIIGGGHDSTKTQ